MDAPLEEAGAAVTAVDAVVLTGAPVAANLKKTHTFFYLLQTFDCWPKQLNGCAKVPGDNLTTWQFDLSLKLKNLARTLVIC